MEENTNKNPDTTHKNELGGFPNRGSDQQKKSVFPDKKVETEEPVKTEEEESEGNDQESKKSTEDGE